MSVAKISHAKAKESFITLLTLLNLSYQIENKPLSLICELLAWYNCPFIFCLILAVGLTILILIHLSDASDDRSVH